MRPQAGNFVASRAVSRARTYGALVGLAMPIPTSAGSFYKASLAVPDTTGALLRHFVNAITAGRDWLCQSHPAQA